MNITYLDSTTNELTYICHSLLWVSSIPLKEQHNQKSVRGVLSSYGNQSIEIAPNTAEMIILSMATTFLGDLIVFSVQTK